MNVTHVTTPEQYDALLTAVQRSSRVAVDLETTGLDALTDTILLLAVSTQDSRRWVVGFNDFSDISALRRELATKLLIAHNAKFECKFLTTHAVAPEEVPRRWYCTQVAESLITSGLRGATGSDDEEDMVPLSEIRQKYLGLSTDKSLQRSFVGVDPATYVPTPEQVAYAAQDVEGLHEVMRAQLRRCESEDLLRVVRLEMAVLPALADMELNGFYLNLGRHAEVLAGYVQQEAEQRLLVEATLKELYQRRVLRWNAERKIQYAALQEKVLSILPGGRVKKDTPPDLRQAAADLRKVRDAYKPLPLDAFNLGSSKQVWNALAEAGIELYKSDWDEAAADYIQKKTTDKNVVKAEAAKAGANPVLAQYAAWGKAAKVVSTYGESLRKKVNPKTGRIHTDYNQNVSSGRLSSLKPNMQNMPEAIRACFEAAEGKVLIVADGKNQEGRLAAILSGDPNLLETFRQNIDWHSRTAALAYPEKFATWQDVDKDTPGKGKEERAGCKNANFSGIYGGTAATLVARGYVPNLQVGERLMQASYEFAPEVRATALRNADHAVEHGWVATISGRKRYFQLPPKPKFDKKSKLWRRYAKQRGGVRRAAMNHPVQGSGADIMKLAMVLLLEPMAALGGKGVAMVHDELVYEVWEVYAEEAAALVAEKMELAAACFSDVLPIPAEVHVTRRWVK